MDQYDEEIAPAIPVKQDLVPFQQITLLGVCLPDNRVAALFSLLCEILHLDRSGQVRRIKADPAIADCLIPARIETPGGPQVLNVLIAGAIPTWLSGIKLGKVAPELRPLLLALKREAADVLYRHFFHSDPEPAPPPERERLRTPPNSPRELIQQGFQMIDQAFQMLEAHHQATDEHLTTLATQHAATQEAQQVMSARLTSLEGRREAQEEMQQAMGAHLVNVSEYQEVAEERWKALGDYVVETRERVIALEQQQRGAPAGKAADAPATDSPLLSPPQLAQLFALALQARRERGTPISAQLAALAEALGVEDVSDLPESAWEDVLAWFWEQRGR